MVPFQRIKTFLRGFRAISRFVLGGAFSCLFGEWGFMALG